MYTISKSQSLFFKLKHLHKLIKTKLLPFPHYVVNTYIRLTRPTLQGITFDLPGFRNMNSLIISVFTHDYVKSHLKAIDTYRYK